MNTCGLTRAIVAGALVGMATAALTASDGAGVAAAVVAAVALVALARAATLYQTRKRTVCSGGSAPATGEPCAGLAPSCSARSARRRSRQIALPTTSSSVDT